MKWIPGSFTKRALVVGLIAGSGILAATSFASTAGDPVSKAGCEARHGQKHHGDHDRAKWAEKRAAHLSGLKAKLDLKPEQEAAWKTFVGAAHPGMQRASADRKAMRGEFQKLNTPQRLDKMQALSDMRRARMLERAEAIKAFYAQLSPEQQKVFDAEAMPNRHRGHEQHRIQS
jgi:hypothetical protein